MERRAMGFQDVMCYLAYDNPVVGAAVDVTKFAVCNSVKFDVVIYILK